MELRLLRYFLAVSQEKSITGAARALNVTQPTLSRQLKDLEEELGQQLLIRSNHNVSLTAEGNILRKRAEEILELVGKTKDEFNSMQETISGDVYIGGGETSGMRVIAGLVKHLQEKFPAIRYHLYSGNADDVIERLDKGLLDFGILIQPTDLSRYNCLDLPDKDVWGLLMKKDSPLAEKESITREDLLQLPLICSRQVMRRNFSRNEFLDWFGEDFQKLNIVVTYNLLFNAALFVEQGIGSAITLDKLVNTMDTSNLCFKPFFPRLESSLNIVWKKYPVFSPAAKTFLEALNYWLENGR